MPAIVGIFAATLSLGTTMTASFAQTNQMDQTRDQARICNPFTHNNATTTTTTNTTITTLGMLILRENGHCIVSRVIEVTGNSYTIENTNKGNGVFNGTTLIVQIITTATIHSAGQIRQSTRIAKNI